MRNKWMFLGLFCLMFSCKTNQQGAQTAPLSKDPLLWEAISRLKEDGYRTLAGRLPLEEQLAESWRYQREKDAGGEMRNFVVSVKADGESYEAARLQGESMAKVQLAGLMETRVGQLVTSRIESKDSGTVMSTVASSKSLVTRRLANLYPLMEVYRSLPEGGVEIQLVMGCDRRWASEIAWSVISADIDRKMPRRSSFSFVLTGLKGAYNTGESFGFSLRSSENCYYHIFVFDADGVEQLFPGMYEKGELFYQEKEYLFPRTPWVRYCVEKGERPVRFEQNILLIVATLNESPFTGKVTVTNVLGWMQGIPEEQYCEQYFSFLAD